MATAREHTRAHKTRTSTHMLPSKAAQAQALRKLTAAIRVCSDV